MVKYKYRDLFIHAESDNAYPFNINFQRKKEFDPIHFYGPGIYLIAFKNKVVYIGKYRPNNMGDVQRERWIHHVATLTGRGDKVGFGKLDRWFKRFKPLFDENGVSVSQLDKRGRDTGTVTSYNRIRFSFENHESFKGELDMSTFSFYYFRNERLSQSRLDALENALIKTINPPANNQFRLKDGTLSLKVALSKIDAEISLLV